MDAPISDTGRLIEIARAGNHDAFAEALAYWRAPLVVFMRRSGAELLGAEFDVDDAIQETFARAWRLLPSLEYRGSRALFRWLVELARGVLLDRRKYRGASRRRFDRIERHGDEFDPPEDATSICGRAIRREETARVDRALAQLPPTQRIVVEMHLFEARSLGDIATALGIAKNAVWERLQRGLAEMRRNLTDVGGTR